MVRWPGSGLRVKRPKGLNRCLVLPSSARLDASCGVWAAGTPARLCYPITTGSFLLTNLKRGTEGQGRKLVARLHPGTHNTHKYTIPATAGSHGACRALPPQETAGGGQGPCSTQANSQLALGTTHRDSAHRLRGGHHGTSG